ncbi:MAG TPA: glycosyltransferase family 9 protein [Longimicrobiales bacterium]
MSAVRTGGPAGGGRRVDDDPIAARPWRGTHPPRRILAIRLHALGDTVLTLPYLQALRRALPDATLDFLTREEVADIPRGVDLFDRVFAFGGGRDPRRMWLAALALAPRLVARRYDVVIDLQRNRLSRALRMLMAPRAWSEFDRLSPRLAGERTRATIEAVGFGPLDVYPDVSPREPELGVDALRAAGWDGAGDLVVLNPAGVFPGRSWPIESYVRFARLWLERESGPTRFAVLGLGAIAEKARALKRRLGDDLLDFTGRTTPLEAFAIVRRARLVLTEDSGLMHMAWVAGAPTLALFGASPAHWARPHGSHSDCVNACRRTDGACVAAGRCHAGPPSCLEHVTAEAVVERASALVRRVAREPKVICVDGRAYAPPLR